MNKIVVLSFCTQIVSYARILVIAAYFGASDTLDAYYTALVLPTFFSGALNAILQGSFLPVYVGLLIQNDRRSAAALRGTIFWIIFFSLTLLAVLLSVFAPYWPQLLGQGGTAAHSLTTQAARALAFALPFLGLFEYCGLVLNAHKKFALAVAAPIANVIVSVAILAWFGATLDSLTGSLVAGTIAQAAVVLVGFSMEKLDLVPQFSSMRLQSRRVGRLALATSPSFILTQLQIAFVQTLPVTLDVGAMSIFGYATRLQGAIEQIFVMGLGTVMLPHLAHLVSRGDHPEIRTTFRHLAIYAGLGSIGVLAVTYAFGPNLVFFLLGRGEFDRALAEQVAHVWFWLALTMFPLAINTALTKLTLAFQNPMVLLSVAVVSLLSAFALGPIFARHGGLQGIAMVLLAIQVVRFLAYAFALKFGSRAII